MQTFRAVPNHPEWQASNTGEIRLTPTGKVRVGSTTKRGYMRVIHYYGPNKTLPKCFAIHRLVAMAWVDNPLGYKEVNHIDGNKTNNHPSNLEWCSRSHNIRHSYETGLRKRGIKLSPTQAQSILDRSRKGESTKALALEFGVKETTVSSIKGGWIWKKLNREPFYA